MSILNMVLTEGKSILTNIGELSSSEVYKYMNDPNFGVYSVRIGDIICLTRFRFDNLSKPAIIGRKRYFVKTEKMDMGVYLYNKVSDGIFWEYPKTGNYVYRAIGNPNDPNSMDIILDRFTEVREELIDSDIAQEISSLIGNPVGIVVNSFPSA